MDRARPRRGFTLLEMLIVTAVIAVLAAVAIPAFGGSLESARRAVDDANERSAKALAAVAELTGELSAEGGPVSLEGLAPGAAQSYVFLESGALRWWRDWTGGAGAAPGDGAYWGQSKAHRGQVLEVIAAGEEDGRLTVEVQWFTVKGT